ncbi:MAG TPA: hypothetical protein VE913_22825 [Longimicrobium sp.]|nr:hypothetical protein [Longimicrobium sp.]
MSYDFSLDRGGLMAVVAGLVAAGGLLFVAGFLAGAVAASKEPELAPARGSSTSPARSAASGVIGGGLAGSK